MPKRTTTAPLILMQAVQSLGIAATVVLDRARRHLARRIQPYGHKRPGKLTSGF